ncbi:ATP-binding cassette domain-containing protein [Methanoculleus sp.]|uniref:ATP-binding cassette domain-containing protein n=1 Tax=Methanoculleus sp. TaxID=90427 RepID=UPI0025D7AB45|nr:ATP-binding cassette domain-containing protein [Methanoculleus sp.]
MVAFTVEDLLRRLDRLQARGPIPFDVRSGEIVGLLCTGGQGRQTLVAILTTMLFPLSGFAERSSLAILGNLGDMRRSMGIVLGESVLDPALTGRENLDFHARLHGLGDDLRRRRVLEVMEFVGLSGSLDAAVETYSPVMVRRLEIARAFLAHPGVLFLAEPTKGLDESDREEIWGLLRRLNRERRVTIVFTTHDVAEAEAVCTRVAVVDGGEVVALDTPDTFRAVMAANEVPLKFDDAA